jgi:hypothetical protein
LLRMPAVPSSNPANLRDGSVQPNGDRDISRPGPFPRSANAGDGVSNGDARALPGNFPGQGPGNPCNRPKSNLFFRFITVLAWGSIVVFQRLLIVGRPPAIWWGVRQRHHRGLRPPSRGRSSSGRVCEQPGAGRPGPWWAVIGVAGGGISRSQPVQATNLHTRTPLHPRRRLGCCNGSTAPLRRHDVALEAAAIRLGAVNRSRRSRQQKKVNPSRRRRRGRGVAHARFRALS